MVSHLENSPRPKYPLAQKVQPLTWDVFPLGYKSLAHGLPMGSHAFRVLSHMSPIGLECWPKGRTWVSHGSPMGLQYWPWLCHGSIMSLLWAIHGLILMSRGPCCWLKAMPHVHSSWYVVLAHAAHTPSKGPSWYIVLADGFGVMVHGTYMGVP